MSEFNTVKRRDSDYILYSGYYRGHQRLGYMMILLVVLHQPLHVITARQENRPRPSFKRYLTLEW